MSATLQRAVRAIVQKVTGDDHEPTDVSWSITVHLEKDELDGGWIAELAEFPGCMSQGETEEEALNNVFEAFTEVITAKATLVLDSRHASSVEPAADHRSETVKVLVS